MSDQPGTRHLYLSPVFCCSGCFTVCFAKWFLLKSFLELPISGREPAPVCTARPQHLQMLQSQMWKQLVHPPVCAPAAKYHCLQRFGLCYIPAVRHTGPIQPWCLCLTQLKLRAGQNLMDNGKHRPVFNLDKWACAACLTSPWALHRY